MSLFNRVLKVGRSVATVPWTRVVGATAAATVRIPPVRHAGAARPKLELIAKHERPDVASAITKITNLLYDFPDENMPEDVEGQLVSLLVEDEPGVLSRTATLLSGRGYNIKSLTV